MISIFFRGFNSAETVKWITRPKLFNRIRCKCSFYALLSPAIAFFVNRFAYTRAQLQYWLNTFFFLFFSSLRFEPSIWSIPQVKVFFIKYHFVDERLALTITLIWSRHFCYTNSIVFFLHFFYNLITFHMNSLIVKTIFFSSKMI